MSRLTFLPGCALILCGSLFVPCVTAAAVISGGSDTGGTTIPAGTDTGVPVSNGGLYNPLGTTDLWTLVNAILAFIIKVGAVVIVFMIVYVGFMFVTARGNESKLGAAKQALLWTIVGAVVLLGAQVISQGVCQTVQALFPGGSLTCPA